MNGSIMLSIVYSSHFTLMLRKANQKNMEKNNKAASA